MASAAARLLVGLVALGLGGCTAGLRGPAPPAAGKGAGAESVAAAGEGRRELYRVGYQGPSGGGSLRLALLVAAEEGYQARASDGFGRALWSLEVSADRATLVDHRQRRYCVSDGELEIPELALGALPLERLPAVLAGELPAEPRRPADDRGDFVDAAGRRWTSSVAGDRVEAWTLWREGRPLVWWKRSEPGAVLSHRDGAQLRWRRSVAEALEAPLAALVVPAEYTAAGCEELAVADGAGPGAPG